MFCCRRLEGEASAHGKGRDARLLEHSAPGLPLASLEIRVRRSFPNGAKPRVRSQRQVASPVLTCLPYKGEDSYRRHLQGTRCKCHLPGRVLKCSSPFFVHSASPRTGGDTCRHSLGGRARGKRVRQLQGERPSRTEGRPQCGCRGACPCLVIECLLL